MGFRTLELNPTQHYYGHGKLLLSGEYFVLDGALALALPTRLGQHLNVRYGPSFSDPCLTWTAFDCHKKKWLQAQFEFWHFELLDGEATEEKLFLQKILRQIRKQNPHFLRDEVNVFVDTRLEFPLEWGLGSSSSLIFNMAKWAYIGPFELLFKTVGGSGYDIACAQAEGPILYKKGVGGPSFRPIHFNPAFIDGLYFVYLGQKSDSQKAIHHYHKKGRGSEACQDLVVKLSSLTGELLNAQQLPDFELLIYGHEKLISEALEIPLAKEVYFKDFWGAIKSLGAWGGDFVLATSDRGETQTREYFAERGFTTFFPYRELIMPSSKGPYANTW